MYLHLNNEEVHNLTLVDIENILQSNRKNLKDYPSMPYPNGFVISHLGNMLVYA